MVYESFGSATPRRAPEKPLRPVGLPRRAETRPAPGSPAAEPVTPMGAFNYFNYFTEIEEYFWRKRGAHLLVSPLDWAIVETWQKAGIPLPAVLKGIDRAFESYQRSRRGAGGRQLKSLAYCVEAVLDAAAQDQEGAAGSGPQTKTATSNERCSRDELRGFFERHARRFERSAEKLHATGPELAARSVEA